MDIFASLWQKTLQPTSRWLQLKPFSNFHYITVCQNAFIFFFLYSVFNFNIYSISSLLLTTYYNRYWISKCSYQTSSMIYYEYPSNEFLTRLPLQAGMVLHYCYCVLTGLEIFHFIIHCKLNNKMDFDTFKLFVETATAKKMSDWRYALLKLINHDVFHLLSLWPSGMKFIIWTP